MDLDVRHRRHHRADRRRLGRAGGGVDVAEFEDGAEDGSGEAGEGGGDEDEEGGDEDEGGAGEEAEEEQVESVQEGILEALRSWGLGFWDGMNQDGVCLRYLFGRGKGGGREGGGRVPIGGVVGRMCWLC